jgi:hypothetical protein
MPAFSENKWYCLIFVVFLLLTMYIFLSILLAVVYDGYRGHLKVCSQVTHNAGESCPPRSPFPSPITVFWLVSPVVVE